MRRGAQPQPGGSGTRRVRPEDRGPLSVRQPYDRRLPPSVPSTGRSREADAAKLPLGSTIMEGDGTNDNTRGGRRHSRRRPSIRCRFPSLPPSLPPPPFQRRFPLSSSYIPGDDDDGQQDGESAPLPTPVQSTEYQNGHITRDSN